MAGNCAHRLLILESRNSLARIGEQLSQFFDVRRFFTAGEFLRSSTVAGTSLAIVGPLCGVGSDEVGVAEALRDLDPTLPVLLIVDSRGSEDNVIRALRCGVRDYFRTPCLLSDVVASVRRILLRSSPEDLFSPDSAPRMVGRSPEIHAINNYIRKVSQAECTVLLTGETGTGKELVAESIHKRSRRAAQPFVRVNCAAIPDTLLESELFGHERGAFTGAEGIYHGQLRMADKGTVFLDEIGDMSPLAQAKVLRAIETKQVLPLGAKKPFTLDVRFLAATNHDLEKLIDQGRFRSDLYFRINVCEIHLPRLRERKEDIPLLIDHFLSHLGQISRRRILGFSEDAFSKLLEYDWPGNVREVRNLCESLLIDPPTKRVSVDNLPDLFRQRLQRVSIPKVDERDRLVAILSSTNWNKTAAAKKLQWSRMTLYRKMAKYGIGQ